MQAMFLDMLHQRAAGRMDNAFWRACCPGAIQDIKRIIEANAAKTLYRAWLRLSANSPLFDMAAISGRASR